MVLLVGKKVLSCATSRMKHLSWTVAIDMVLDSYRLIQLFVTTQYHVANI